MVCSCTTHNCLDKKTVSPTMMWTSSFLLKAFVCLQAFWMLLLLQVDFKDIKALVNNLIVLLTINFIAIVITNRQWWSFFTDTTKNISLYVLRVMLRIKTVCWYKKSFGSQNNFSEVKKTRTQAQRSKVGHFNKRV